MGIQDRDGFGQAAKQGPGSAPPGFVPWSRAPVGVFSMALLWMVIGVILYLLVRSFVPGFQPLRVTARQADELLLTSDRSGNYTVPGSINGVPTTFLVDTGASVVSVSAVAADRMGLSGCEGIASQTANGRITGRIALACEMRFGPFTVREVRAAVLPAMAYGETLLGMNVLSRMRIEQQGGHMLLRTQQP